MSTLLSKSAFQARAHLALFLVHPTPLTASEGEGRASTQDPSSQSIVGVLVVQLFVLLARARGRRRSGCSSPWARWRSCGS